MVISLVLRPVWLRLSVAGGRDLVVTLAVYRGPTSMRLSAVCVAGFGMAFVAFWWFTSATFLLFMWLTGLTTDLAVSWGLLHCGFLMFVRLVSLRLLLFCFCLLPVSRRLFTVCGTGLNTVFAVVSATYVDK